MQETKTSRGRDIERNASTGWRKFKKRKRGKEFKKMTKSIWRE